MEKGCCASLLGLAEMSALKLLKIQDANANAMRVMPLFMYFEVKQFGWEREVECGWFLGL